MDQAKVFDLDVFDLAGRLLDVYPEPIPFDDFAPYRILRPIGKGGMGEVFLAEDQAAGRSVAIKFLRNAWSDPDLHRHFSGEIHTLAKLEHPYIARLYELGVHPNGTPYFAMEYVEGKPLDEYCRDKKCSLEERMRLFRSVCEAVLHAHSRAVIHLDLKPANILIKEDGTPKLLDFGIARHLRSLDEPVVQTQLRCTPAYASPEQIRREPVGTYTDVYALGVVLYELLAGRSAQYAEGCTPGEMEAKIARGEEPGKPSASPVRVEASKAAWSDLNVLCLRAMRKDVHSRYPSVVELTQDIDHFLRQEPLKARPDRLSYRLSKFLRRNFRPVIAAAAVLALLAGLIAFYTVRLKSARDAAVMESARAQRIQRFMSSLFGGDYNAAPSGDLRVVDILDRGVREAGLLKKDPAVQAELYETLGSNYQSLGKLDRADSLLQSALAARRSVFGPDSPEVADAQVALAVLRIDQAQFADAEQLARQAIAIDELRLSAEDPRLGNAISTLGNVLVHRGKYLEAIKVLERSVRIQSAPTADPVDLEESLTFLANARHYLGNDAAAELLDRRVLALDRQIYGDRHPSVAEDYSNLGQAQEQIGLYAEAERNDRRALEIVQAWYGNDHVEAAVDAEGLAGTLICEHKYDEAVRLLRPSLTTLRRDFGKDHPLVAWGLNLSGIAALRQGHLEDAETDFRHMSEIYRSTFGDKDRHVAMSLLRFGELYDAKMDYPRAEQHFRDSVQLFSEVLSADNVQTGTARIELGGTLLREQRYKEAEAELLAGYQIVKRDRSPNLEAAVQARRDLISVYEALHVPEKAAEFRAKPAMAEREADLGKGNDLSNPVASH